MRFLWLETAGPSLKAAARTAAFELGIATRDIRGKEHWPRIADVPPAQGRAWEQRAYEIEALAREEAS